jgi:hypothetical protein
MLLIGTCPDVLCREVPPPQHAINVVARPAGSFTAFFNILLKAVPTNGA